MSFRKFGGINQFDKHKNVKVNNSTILGNENIQGSLIFDNWNLNSENEKLYIKYDNSNIVQFEDEIIKVDNLFRFGNYEELPNLPIHTDRGTMLYDLSLHNFRYWDGTTWKVLDSHSNITGETLSEVLVNGNNANNQNIIGVNDINVNKLIVSGFYADIGEGELGQVTIKSTSGSNFVQQRLAFDTHNSGRGGGTIWTTPSNDDFWFFGKRYQGGSPIDRIRLIHDNTLKKVLDSDDQGAVLDSMVWRNDGVIEIPRNYLDMVGNDIKNINKIDIGHNTQKRLQLYNTTYASFIQTGDGTNGSGGEFIFSKWNFPNDRTMELNTNTKISKFYGDVNIDGHDIKNLGNLTFTSTNRNWYLNNIQDSNNATFIGIAADGGADPNPDYQLLIGRRSDGLQINNMRAPLLIRNGINGNPVLETPTGGYLLDVSGSALIRNELSIKGDTFLNELYIRNTNTNFGRIIVNPGILYIQASNSNGDNQSGGKIRFTRYNTAITTLEVDTNTKISKFFGDVNMDNHDISNVNNLDVINVNIKNSSNLNQVRTLKYIGDSEGRLRVTDLNGSNGKIIAYLDDINDTSNNYELIYDNSKDLIFKENGSIISIFDTSIKSELNLYGLLRMNNNNIVNTAKIQVNEIQYNNDSFLIYDNVKKRFQKTDIFGGTIKDIAYLDDILSPDNSNLIIDNVGGILELKENGNIITQTDIRELNPYLELQTTTTNIKAQIFFKRAGASEVVITQYPQHLSIQTTGSGTPNPDDHLLIGRDSGGGQLMNIRGPLLICEQANGDTNNLIDVTSGKILDVSGNSNFRGDMNIEESSLLLQRSTTVQDAVLKFRYRNSSNGAQVSLWNVYADYVFTNNLPTLNFVAITTAGVPLVTYSMTTNGGVLIGTTFTGQHRYPLMNNKIIDGMIVSIVPNTLNEETINIIESLPNSQITTKAYDKAVAGVYSSIKQDFSPLQSDKEINEKINSLGEGAIWVCNINGNLEIGDYIVSSNIPGIGMKQDDDLLHNYTVAKASLDCDFNPQLVENFDLSFNRKNNKVNLNYDENGDLIKIQREKELEYECKELDVFKDKYIIWDDIDKTIVKFLYKFNFEQNDDYKQLIGNSYKVAFIGCTYHCN